MMEQKAYAILLAGGSGSRMGAPVNKVLLSVAGVPCILRSAVALAPFVSGMVLVCRAGEEAALRRMFLSAPISVPVYFAQGGRSRQESVYHGLCALENRAEPDSWVLIHDGARCLVSEAVIRNVLLSLERFGSGVAALPVTDTLRPADPDLRLSGNTVSREHLYAMQTPQGFRLADLNKAFQQAERDGFEGTDDASVMVHAGFSVHLSEGSRYNIKLTTREDLQMAEQLLGGFSFPPFRIGQGYDVHQLKEGRKLILCGVEIPHSLGLLGHSDADVAVHALMDALLGAAGLGDIGRHFPDTDSRYEGADSMKLLDAVMQMLGDAGFHPVNVDVTIVAQRPKLSPFIPQMAENLAKALDLPISHVNVKATTTERLGFEGRMEGISAQAVCLLHFVKTSAACSAGPDHTD